MRVGVSWALLLMPTNATPLSAYSLARFASASEYWLLTVHSVPRKRTTTAFLSLASAKDHALPAGSSSRNALTVFVSARRGQRPARARAARETMARRIGKDTSGERAGN